MFWWDKAAELTRTGKAKRFGFITTNSLRQTFNRKVLQHHMDSEEADLIGLRHTRPDPAGWIVPGIDRAYWCCISAQNVLL
jgi:hypothetical protein